ncbi:hypothetical protein R3P38DRAFT_99513 [Favolaschia claudopus]|uniref:Uncharacterized protein n=1 Tax=Favolaschia claudopus TaxID=2862362 RepID=A0AAV9ZXK4_9AGAR
MTFAHSRPTTPFFAHSNDPKSIVGESLPDKSSQLSLRLVPSHTIRALDPSISRRTSALIQLLDDGASLDGIRFINGQIHLISCRIVSAHAQRLYTFVPRSQTASPSVLRCTTLEGLDVDIPAFRHPSVKRISPCRRYICFPGPTSARTYSPALTLPPAGYLLLLQVSFFRIHGVFLLAAPPTFLSPFLTSSSYLSYLDIFIIRSLCLFRTSTRLYPLV